VKPTAMVGQPSTARGRRTRGALVQAACEVFEEQGFAEVKISDIPSRAGVSYGAFYTYFDSKEAIFREVVNATTGEMFQASRSGVGEDGSPVDRIREATSNAGIMRVIEQVAPGNAYFRTLLSDIRALFVQRIAGGIKRLQDEGLADADLDTQVAATALGGMVENFARQWFLFGETYDEGLVLETLTRLWAKGIGLRLESLFQLKLTCPGALPAALDPGGLSSRRHPEGAVHSDGFPTGGEVDADSDALAVALSAGVSGPATAARGVGSIGDTKRGK
jgi:AcrR family transcriptional regulator